MTEQQHPTTRELITDLLAALKSWSPTGGGPLEGAEEQYEAALIAKAEAFLAQPEPEEPTDEELRRRFLTWWNEEGSAMRPLSGHDYEEHARRISEIAWANGAYVARWGK